MSDLKLLVQLQAKVSIFLAELSADQLLALAEGRAGLTLSSGSQLSPQPGGAAIPRPADIATPPPVRPRATKPGSREALDPTEVVARLRSCESPDEATVVLASLKPSAEDLKLIAKALNISATGRKDDLSKRILNITVGARSKHAALRQG